MQQNSVRPILEKGCLICPQCGEGKMPTNRTCCWSCGVRFENSFAVPPQAQMPETQETQQSMKTFSMSPAEKSRMIGGAKENASFEKAELAHSCRVLHKWLGILCAAMGMLWFFDTATPPYDYGSYSLLEAFDNGFVAICAIILNGCAAFSAIIVSANKDSQYNPSFWYNFMFGLSSLFNLLGMWSLNGRSIMADNLERLYAFSSEDFPYAYDTTVLGVIFTLIVITYFILTIPYGNKYRKLKKY